MTVKCRNIRGNVVLVARGNTLPEKKDNKIYHSPETPQKSVALAKN